MGFAEQSLGSRSMGMSSRFASRLSLKTSREVLSVVIRPTNQLKITFLEVCGAVCGAVMVLIWRLHRTRSSSSTSQTSSRQLSISSCIHCWRNCPRKFKWEDDGIKLRSAAIPLAI